MSPPDLATLILAAGKGTRMKSALAKVLHPVAGRPMLAYALDLAALLKASPNILILGHQADGVRKAVEGSGCRIVLQDPPQGTGHAARVGMEALGEFEGTVAILYADIPLLRVESLQAALAHHTKTCAALTVITFQPPDATGYGRILRNPQGRMYGIVEHRDANADQHAIGECNTGLYLADAAWLRRAVERIKPENVQQEYYLTDAVDIVLGLGGVVETFPLADPDEAQGINDRADLARVERSMRTRINLAHMRNGVTLTDPDRTLIEAGVEIAADVLIEPDAILSGRTRIARGCVIQAGVRIEDSVISANCVIKQGSVIEESEVGEGTQIGPMAHLRPGTVLGREVRIGNFVETKKARIGDGTKANHLSYLGDAEIGGGSNIGCGTITCNYDGEKKHVTTIGDRVFIGSDSQLVAPVKVGSDAYVGSGTTVTADVPEGALAVSRVKQKNIEGWVARKRGGQKAKD